MLELYSLTRYPHPTPFLVSCSQGWLQILYLAKEELPIPFPKPLSAEIASVHTHAWFIRCWGLNLGLQECSASALLTELHPNSGLSSVVFWRKLSRAPLLLAFALVWNLTTGFPKYPWMDETRRGLWHRVELCIQLSLLHHFCLVTSMASTLTLSL